MVELEPVLGLVVLGLVVELPLELVCAWAVAKASVPAARATVRMRVNMGIFSFRLGDTRRRKERHGI